MACRPTPAPPKHAPAPGSTHARGALDGRYLPEQRMPDNIVDHILVRHLTPIPIRESHQTEDKAGCKKKWNAKGNQAKEK